jgi:hypothetical protein
MLDSETREKKRVGVRETLERREKFGMNQSRFDIT